MSSGKNGPDSILVAINNVLTGTHSGHIYLGLNLKLPNIATEFQWRFR